MLNLTHAVRAVFLMWLQRDTLKRLPLADLGLIEECLKDESCRHATHDIFQTMNLKLDDKTFLRLVGRIIITTKLMRKMETLCGVGATICSGCDKNELTVQLLKDRPRGPPIAYNHRYTHPIRPRAFFVWPPHRLHRRASSSPRVACAEE